MIMRRSPIPPLALLALLLAPKEAGAARIKELAELEGARPNAIVGFGIVIGLDGTGDDATSFLSRRPLAMVMKHLGTNIDPADIRARNVAAVMVTGNLPAYGRPGVAFDVTVSSIGTAKSLQGGTLVATSLKGLDRETYAFAQGPLTVGGYEVSSSLSLSTQKKNHVTVGRIPGGAIIERAIPQQLPAKEITLHLKEPDFTTATRIASAIDKALADKAAKVEDAGVVKVTIGKDWTDRVVELIAKLESIDAEPDAPAKVIIDERTGTVVVGQSVTLGPAAIAYGGIYVNVLERFNVSQPAPFSLGKSIVVPETQIDVKEEDRKMQVIPHAATVGDVAKALNSLGVKPRDLVPIFQALKAAGALRAEIQVL
jgi:flagellar P-ring protein precursor FlgI